MQRGRHFSYTQSIYLISYVGVGSLRVAHIPEEFKGFQGTIVHTTHWDPTVDFTDKRVAIVGSGSSAIQAIPTLADAASVLYSYQRTPAWCIVRKQYHYSALFKFFLKYVPLVARIYRLYLFLLVSFVLCDHKPVIFFAELFHSMSSIISTLATTAPIWAVCVVAKLKSRSGAALRKMAALIWFPP